MTGPAQLQEDRCHPNCMQLAQNRGPRVQRTTCRSGDASYRPLWFAVLCFFLFFYSNSGITIFNIFFELIQHSEKTNPTLWINQFNIFRINVEIVYYICWNDQFKNVKIVLSPSQNNCNYRVQNLSHKNCNFDLPTTKHKTISERFLQKIITTSSTPHKRKMIFL